MCVKSNIFFYFFLVRFAELEQLKPDQEPRTFTCDTREDETERKQLMAIAREAATKHMSPVTKRRTLKIPSKEGFDTVHHTVTRKMPEISMGSTKPLVMLSLQVSSMKAFAHKLADLLRTNGYDVWICTQSMTGGATWRREIVKAVKNCHIFVPLINNPWAESGECEVEFNLAFNLHTHSNSKPRMPIFVPVAFPDLDWSAHAHVELLAANTNFVKHEQNDQATYNTILESCNKSFHKTVLKMSPAPKIFRSANSTGSTSSTTSTTSTSSVESITLDVASIKLDDHPQLHQFLSKIKLLKYGYGQKLIEEGFDTLELIMLLTVEDMVEMNIKKGHRRVLLRSIQSMSMDMDKDL